jgi:hypothetical protein
LALLGKLGWKLMAELHSLVARILKARYFLSGDFLNAHLGHKPSFIRWSIHNSQELIKMSCGWWIGMGNMVNIWNDAWLIDDNNRFIETQVVKGLEMEICGLDLGEAVQEA